MLGSPLLSFPLSHSLSLFLLGFFLFAQMVSWPRNTFENLLALCPSTVGEAAGFNF